MRYTLCIKFIENRTNILINDWDIRQDFKSMKEAEPYLNLVDETCKRAILFDNATGKSKDLILEVKPVL